MEIAALRSSFLYACLPMNTARNRKGRVAATSLFLRCKDFARVAHNKGEHSRTGHYQHDI